MPKLAISTKRALIDKANTTVVALTGGAVFVLIFCAVASKTLISQAGYQNRIISSKKTAVSQLKADVGAVNTLKTSYDAFTNTTQNVLGGNPNGTGQQDGNNAKIVLDALPSSYDFPALTTSIEKLVTSQQLTISSITGTDDEVAQSSNASSSTPAPVPMPFEVTAMGGYANIQGLITTFERSIRPIQLQTLEIDSGDNGLSVTVSAQTFYQPAKSLNITSKVIQ